MKHFFIDIFQGMSEPIDFIFEPPKRRRRRRVICREVTDSESDDDRGHSSHHHHRRDRHDSEPARLHSLLGNVWRKTKNASENLSQSNTRPNTNSPRQSMQNKSPPVSSQNQGDIGNVWNRAVNTSDQKPAGFSGILNRMKSSGGNVIQPPPPGPQQNQEAIREFFAARNALAAMSQPNTAVANVWNRADNVAQYRPPPTSNPPWNPMSSSPFPMNPAWNQMSGGAPPPQPPYAMNPAWNQMSGGAPPPQQSPPGMNPSWNPMSGGAPPPPLPPQQQQQPPLSSSTSSFFNRMFGGGSSPQ
jgi:hypothetical protein